ncbi:MAG: right-handed parallel beta-helix repeat-containing protein [Candidatus Yanofskybacteria bacterium]|nr:right-handed parallel beta-helix repeat-containing protein [Candidatus Yanofskybacteria bacterium]
MRLSQKVLFVTALLGGILFSRGVSADTTVSGHYSTDQHWTLADSPYIVEGFGEGIVIQPGVTLTIDPGVIVKFKASTQLWVDGAVIARGTAEQPIIFTSFYDDSAGGDTDGLGPTVGSSGDWWHISGNDPHLEFDYAQIRFSGLGFSLTLTDSLVLVTNSIIENGGYGFRLTQTGTNLTIENNIIRGNGYGFFFDQIFDSSNFIKNNVISNNSYRGAYSLTPDAPVDMRNNSWGDPSGPFHPSLNSSGLGNQVSDGILFDPWSEKVPPPIAKTPVIIVPGIAGSELKDGENLIWADLDQMFFDVDDQFITEKLRLDESGQPINAEIQVGEAIKRIFSVPLLDVNIFNDLQDKLESEGYILNQDLFFFPYDWRLDLNDTASGLADKIEQIKSQTGADKVDIVAHSMGGLLTKEYIRQNGKSSIDKLIFVGTPHIGAPKAGKIVFAGDKMGIPWLAAARVKEVGEHSIAVHELLPNSSYFAVAGAYIKNSEGDSLDYEQTKQLLIEQGSTPDVFNAAEDFFTHGLESTDFVGIDAYNIVGCKNETQAGYQAHADGTMELIKYSAGDKTVPLISADEISISIENKFYATDGTHAELPSRPGIRNLIADILTDQPITNYENVSADSSVCGIEGQELIWRSPVEVHIYDSQGRHTGPTGNDTIEYGIPEVGYEIFGHEKFIFVPSNAETYQIIGHGLDTGTFDLSIRQNDNGTVTGASVFNDIPVTAFSEVKLALTGGNIISDIGVDEDGNGTFVSIPATSFLNGVEADDVTPPTVAIILPDLPTYERSLVLPIDVWASDSNSGIFTADIKLDGNSISSPSVDLFFYSLGSHSLDVEAIDRAGNAATTSFSFQVSATPDSVISDINRAYELGWIEKKSVRNGLIQKLKLSISAFIKQLEREYTRGNINKRAYDLLKEDAGWLINLNT